MVKLKEQENAISIKNVKAIEICDIPIPADGGVVVMRGSNGAGKSTAIACVDALMTGDTSGIELRDGEIKGTVEGFGVRLNVGRSKVTRSGKLELIGLEHPIDLATFISPKRQDAKTADKDRIRELVALSGMKTDPSLFYPLFGGEEGFSFSLDEDDTHGKDMIELSGVVKRSLQKQAVEAEKKASELTGKADALRSIDKGLSIKGETDPAKLDAERDEAAAQLGRLESEVAWSATVQRQYEQAKARFNAIPPISTVNIEMEFKTASDRCVEIDTRINEVKSQLEFLLEVRKDAEKNKADLKRQFGEAEKAAQERSELLAIIESGCIEGPTAEQIEAAKKRLADAKKAVTDGALIRDALAKREQAKVVEKRVEGLLADAKELRERAAMVDSIVSKAIKAPGLLIDDGRLVVVTPKRGKVYYHDLSDGERTRIALELAVLRVGTGGLLALQQHFWEGLDGTARAQIYHDAKRLGVVVITAQSTDEIGEQPIAVEVFKPKE